MLLAQQLLHEASERHCASLRHRMGLVENAHISVKNNIKLTIVTIWVRGKMPPSQYFFYLRINCFTTEMKRRK